MEEPVSPTVFSAELAEVSPKQSPPAANAFSPVGDNDDIFSSPVSPPRLSYEIPERPSQPCTDSGNPIVRHITSARVSLRVVLLLMLTCLTVSPALVLWITPWSVGSQALASMKTFTDDSVENVVTGLRSSMTSSAKLAFLNLIQPVEFAMKVSVAQFYGLGWVARDQTIQSNFERDYGKSLTAQFPLAKANADISAFTISTNIATESPFIPNEWQAWVNQAIVYYRYSVNLFTKSPEDYFVGSTALLNEPRNTTLLRHYVTNQTTGKLLACYYTLDFGGVRAPKIQFSGVVEYNWYPDVFFGSSNGFVEFMLQYNIPSITLKTYYHLGIKVRVNTVSQLLRQIVKGPNQRLFILIRNPQGTLLGTSHGKYFSHSDVDYISTIDPLHSLIPVWTFQKYSPINCSDPVISQAGVFLWNTFHTWETIPAFDSRDAFINNELYWVSAANISSLYPLPVQLFLLIDHDSILVGIKAQEQKMISSIRKTNGMLIALLVVVVVAALVVALLTAYFITKPLTKLSNGMVNVATLNFRETAENGLDPGGSILDSSPRCQGAPLRIGSRKKNDRRSRVWEIARCEHSFSAMERGIRAFVKYVPKEVVKLMLAGNMEVGAAMRRRNVTLLFMDLAGFSRLCETISGEKLMRLTFEYVQVMCEVIVQSSGILDKFIGDCIMAIWNAPLAVANHESAACGAALEMQRQLFELWTLWDHTYSLPHIRFRAGINTANVLVGNYGCSYRLSYTVLGDGVNLASRLEGANKLFHSTVLVSEATRDQAKDHFVFRKLGLITVPGKSEVVAVYEPLMSTGVVKAEGSNEPVLFRWILTDCTKLLAMANAYEQGMSDYLQGNLDEARQFFALAKDALPADESSWMLFKRCIERAAAKTTDPNFAWDGVLHVGDK